MNLPWNVGCDDDAIRTSVEGEATQLERTIDNHASYIPLCLRSIHYCVEQCRCHHHRSLSHSPSKLKHFITVDRYCTLIAWQHSDIHITTSHSNIQHPHSNILYSYCQRQGSGYQNAVSQFSEKKKTRRRYRLPLALKRFLDRFLTLWALVNF